MPKQLDAKITFKQHLQEIQNAEGAVEELPTKQPISLEKLSELMDAYSVTTQEARLAPEPVLIDTEGYLSLCRTVYQTLFSFDAKVDRQISLYEFLLVCGWYLTSRVLECAKDATGLSVLGYDVWKAALPPIHLPTPIAEYLRHLGNLRLPNGQVIYPVMALPTLNPAPNEIQGVYPSSFTTGYLGKSGFGQLRSMYPFGLLKLSFESANHDNSVTLPSLNFVANQQLNGLINSWHLFPIGNRVQPIHKDRYARRATFTYGTSGPLSAALCFSPDIMETYKSCHMKWFDKIHMSEPTIDLAGQATMCAIATPVMTNGQITPADHFRFRCAITLNEGQMQLARIFRMRREIPQNMRPDPNVAQQLDPQGVYTAFRDCLDVLPAYLKYDFTSITTIPSVRALMSTYVALFVKK